MHVYVLRLYVCNACVYMHGVLSYGYCLGAMRYDILHAIAYCTTLCYTMPVCVSYAMLRCTMLCYATLYYVVLCYAILFCAMHACRSNSYECVSKMCSTVCMHVRA